MCNPAPDPTRAPSWRSCALRSYLMRFNMCPISWITCVPSSTGIPGATAKQVTSLKGGTLSLVLGSGFQGVAHKSHKKAKSVSAAALSKNYGGVNGAANICKQSAAYAGPDTPADFGN